jgi:hypothetical protein
MLITACNGSSAAEPTRPSTTGAAPTAAAPTAPAPTTVTPTTTSTTTSTTTPAPITTPPTTAPPTIEEQVRAAAEEHYVTYWQCLRTPDTCPLDTVWLPGSDAHNAMTRTVSELQQYGFYVGDEPYGYMVIESIEQKDDHTLVTTCWRLTGVLYLQPPIDGAEPTIQNNTPGWGRQADQFVQDPSDGVWKVRRSDTLEGGSLENLCPPDEQ